MGDRDFGAFARDPDIEIFMPFLVTPESIREVTEVTVPPPRWNIK